MEFRREIIVAVCAVLAVIAAPSARAGDSQGCLEAANRAAAGECGYGQTCAGAQPHR